MNLNKLCREAHEIAIEKGFNSATRDLGTSLMLIVSELSEALEAERKGEPDVYTVGGKPEGVLIELADAVIRIADLCGAKNWDLADAVQKKLEYNRGREYLHGKRF